MTIKPKENKTRIGGQAVMEGVMMTNPTLASAIAVRKQDGGIALRITPLPQGPKPWYKRVWFVRGVVNFVITLSGGVKTLNHSLEMGGYEDDEEPSRFEKWLGEKTGKSATDIAGAAGIALGIAAAVGLFILLPQGLVSLLNRWVSLNGFWMGLAEGVVRLLVFLGYMAGISAIKDIQRFFAYHGAEHKTVNCYEKGCSLTVENVMGCSTRHPRCGTSFLLVVMVISILVFSLTGLVVETGSSMLLRLALRLALLPVVAAISYEALMALAGRDSFFARLLRAPGMALQALTTREPDEAMCEVAIAAFAPCLPEEERALKIPKPPEERLDCPNDAPGCTPGGEAI